jgi:hypothetical protein
MQLFHHDNGDIEFIRRPIVGQSATEFNEHAEPERAWLDLYQTIYPFNGYKSIPADGIQLAYSRHYYMNVHPLLSKSMRPPEDGNIRNPYLTKISDTQGQLVAKAKKPRSIWDKLTVILGSAVILEMVLWGIMIYVSRH